MAAEKKGMKKQTLTIQVHGQDPQTASAPLYSNFWAISRVGTEVQIEFVFLDLNQIAKLIESPQTAATQDLEPPKIEGKTVSKIVMPGTAFAQVKDHVNRIFREIEEILAKADAGEENGREHASSA